MPLKRPLSVLVIGKARFWTGLVLGALFAAFLYAAGLLTVRLAYPAITAGPEAHVARLEYYNNSLDREGRRRYPPPPVIVAEARAETPAWAEPFWAGLAAALGQAVSIAAWFWTPGRRRAVRPRRERHVRSSIATGLMWVGIMPMVLGKIWFSYVELVSKGAAWAAAFGEPPPVDPILPGYPLGADSALLVVVLIVEPWRGLQMAYRCGWWPVMAAGGVLVIAAALYAAGQWLLPGAG